MAEETEQRDPGAPDEEMLARREAALAQVVQFGDPVLKSVASPVTEFGPDLDREAERMIEIMRGAIGVGLAATQVGMLRRMLVFQSGSDAEAAAVVNPRIEWRSEEVEVAEEGCLSIPRVSVDVERSVFARVRGSDLAGDPLTIEASGLEARVLQHEIDHLDGVLILDRTSREQRREALRALRAGESYHPGPDSTEGEGGHADGPPPEA